MAQAPLAYWHGGSGTIYTFFVFERHPDVEAGQFGNYIYARRDAENRWTPVYIGEGELSVCCGANHPRIDCIGDKGATHVHIRVEASEQQRLAFERDLLANYPNVFAPHGCNVKIGG